MEVLWDRGIKREFKWGSVVFGQTDGQPVMQKPSEPAPERECNHFIMQSRMASYLPCVQRCLSEANIQRLHFTWQLFLLQHQYRRLALRHRLLHPHPHLLQLPPMHRPTWLRIPINHPPRNARLGPGHIKCIRPRYRASIRRRTLTLGTIQPRWRCRRPADHPQRTLVHRARTALSCNGNNHMLVLGLTMSIISQGRQLSSICVRSTLIEKAKATSVY